MTRINVVPVDELCDKHLLAEYRELPRVFKLARVCPEAPREYTLGAGHVKFFYDKLDYLIGRHKELVEECKKRGFKVKYDLPPDLDPPDELFNDYVPTPAALALNRERIALRKSQFKRKASVAVAVLMLAGCAEVVAEKKLNDTTFQFSVRNNSVSASPADEAAMMGVKAEEYCPAGYERLHSKIAVKAGTPTYTWTIKCGEAL